MQNASNQLCGDPWLKNGCATNFETRPRFRVIFVIFFTDLFNVFFLQAETPPAAQQNTFYESFKRPAPGATFQCLDRRQKNNSTNLRKNRRYTFKQKQHIVYFLF